MSWASDPSGPGYYWTRVRRAPLFCDPSIVEVYEDKDGGLRYRDWIIAWDVRNEGRKEFPYALGQNCDWFGPIEAPSC